MSPWTGLVRVHRPGPAQPRARRRRRPAGTAGRLGHDQGGDRRLAARLFAAPCRAAATPPRRGPPGQRGRCPAGAAKATATMLDLEPAGARGRPRAYTRDGLLVRQGAAKGKGRRRHRGPGAARRRTPYAAAMAGHDDDLAGRRCPRTRRRDRHAPVRVSDPRVVEADRTLVTLLTMPGRACDVPRRSRRGCGAGEEFGRIGLVPRRGHRPDRRDDELRAGSPAGP